MPETIRTGRNSRISKIDFFHQEGNSQVNIFGAERSTKPRTRRVWARAVSSVLFVILLLILTTGCATPHWQTPENSDRLGLLDRMAQWPSAHSTGRKPKFAFLKEDSIRAQKELVESPTSEKLVQPATVSYRRGKNGKRRRVLSKASGQPAQLVGGPSGVDGLKWPLNAVEVTSDYGQRGREFHEGVDLKASRGTPIFAAQSGKVLYADSKIRGYGKMVVIQHMNEIATVYAHISKILVRRGQTVIQGQKIALSGQTGRARGPHLHFETRRGLSSVDPLQVLPTPLKSSQHYAINSH